MEEAESRIAAKEYQEIMLSKVLIHTLRVQKDLMERCEDSEGRSRRKNLRIYAVPEKLEGSDMIGFVEKVLCHTLKIEGEIPIERAHRSGQLIQRNNNKPRSILVRFQSYNMRQRVLTGQRKRLNWKITPASTLTKTSLTKCSRREQSTGMSESN